MLLLKSLTSSLSTSAVVYLLIGCGSSGPENGKLKCGTGVKPCPSGFVCSPITATCWKDGTEPKPDASWGPDAAADGPSPRLDLAVVEDGPLPVADTQPEGDALPDLFRVDAPLPTGTGGAPAGTGGAPAGTGGTAGPDAGSFRTFTCEPSCYNQSCGAKTGMCTSDHGRCAAVPCATDTDCCDLGKCDNVVDLCKENRSRYFACESGQCVRAPDGYTGVCTTVGARQGSCQDLCPKSEPVAGTRCDAYPNKCTYGSRTCECSYINKQFVWACYKGYTCESTCFNETCPAAADMCTGEFGRCRPVTCKDESDCCALSKCDNLTDRCSKQASRYFTCTSGQCVRAAEGYAGYCADIASLLPDEATCTDLCPPAQPEHNTRCQSYSSSCTYGTTVCKCQSGTQGILWNCQ
jgi:hypothetical protein